jgi:hypothetical protein
MISDRQNQIGCTAYLAERPRPRNAAPPRPRPRPPRPALFFAMIASSGKSSAEAISNDFVDCLFVREY